MSNIDSPTTWLWVQLETALDAETLAKLRVGYNAQNARYTLASKIRQTEYDIRLFTKHQKIYPVGSKQYNNYNEKLKRRVERLAKLKSEL